MPAYDEAQGANHPWKYTVYQTRLPFNYSSGFTHSFQFALGVGSTVDGLGTLHTSSYWEVRLYAITSSNNVGANFIADPVLVEAKQLTWSLSGADADRTGSVFTTSSYFNDTNGYLTSNSIIILNVMRVSTAETSTTTGDASDYTASCGLVSSQIRYISS